MGKQPPADIYSPSVMILYNELVDIIQENNHDDEANEALGKLNKFLEELIPEYNQGIATVAAIVATHSILSAGWGDSLQLLEIETLAALQGSPDQLVRLADEYLNDLLSELEE